MKISFFVIGLSGAGAGWSAANPENTKARPAIASRQGTILHEVVHGIVRLIFFVIEKRIARARMLQPPHARLNGRS